MHSPSSPLPMIPPRSLAIFWNSSGTKSQPIRRSSRVLEAWIKISPFRSVGQARTSIDLRPQTIKVAQGCLIERAIADWVSALMGELFLACGARFRSGYKVGLHFAYNGRPDCSNRALRFNGAELPICWRLSCGRAARELG